MTTEELTGIGLTDEQASKVFALHGKDITKFKEAAVNLKTMVADLKNKLGDKEIELSDLKKLDAPGMQKKYDDLKAEYETYKGDTEKKDAQRTYNDRRNAFFKDTEFADDYTKRGVLSEFDEKGFKYSDKDNTFSGAKEWLDEIKKSSPTSFKASGAPRVVTSGGNEPPKPLTKSAFDKLTFADKLKFKQENPDGYEALKNAPPKVSAAKE